MVIFDKFSLKGRVAVVVGGSRGIGKAIAFGFADAGADIAIISRKLSDLVEVAQEIEKSGHKCAPLAANVSSRQEIEDTIASVCRQFGRIDILVNSAGTNPAFGPIEDVSEQEWDKTLNVNLKGVFLASQSVGKIMIKQKYGSIINVASTAGLRPELNIGVYSVSKAGIVMLTRVMAKEWAQHNIRVNCIAPYVIKTRFTTNVWENPERLKDVVRNIPMGRIGESEEIVGTALFLASDASSYVTGDSINVDGGHLI